MCVCVSSSHISWRKREKRICSLRHAINSFIFFSSFIRRCVFENYDLFAYFEWNIKLHWCASRKWWFKVEDHCYRWLNFMCMQFFCLFSRWKRYSLSEWFSMCSVSIHSYSSLFFWFLVWSEKQTIVWAKLDREWETERDRVAIALHILTIATKLCAIKITCTFLMEYAKYC